MFTTEIPLKFTIFIMVIWYNEFRLKPEYKTRSVFERVRRKSMQKVTQPNFSHFKTQFSVSPGSDMKKFKRVVQILINY
jgi:hypothetical protein